MSVFIPPNQCRKKSVINTDMSKPDISKAVSELFVDSPETVQRLFAYCSWMASITCTLLRFKTPLQPHDICSPGNATNLHTGHNQS